MAEGVGYSPCGEDFSPRLSRASSHRLKAQMRTHFCYAKWLLTQIPRQRKKAPFRCLCVGGGSPRKKIFCVAKVGSHLSLKPMRACSREARRKIFAVRRIPHYAKKLQDCMELRRSCAWQHAIDFLFYKIFINFETK